MTQPKPKIPAERGMHSRRIKLLVQKRSPKSAWSEGDYYISGAIPLSTSGNRSSECLRICACHNFPTDSRGWMGIKNEGILSAGDDYYVCYYCY